MEEVTREWDAMDRSIESAVYSWMKNANKPTGKLMDVRYFPRGDIIHVEALYQHGKTITLFSADMRASSPHDVQHESVFQRSFTDQKSAFYWLTDHITDATTDGKSVAMDRPTADQSGGACQIM